METQRMRSFSESETAKLNTSKTKREHNKNERIVVCAVDASLHSKNAFNWYLKNIWKPSDFVVVVYCPEVPHLPYLSFKKGITLPVEKWKEIMEDVHQKTWKLEEEYELECRERKLSYKIVAENDAQAGEAILKVIGKEHADMVVMGTRGMGKLKRFLLGSVSEFVLRHSPVATVVVPANFH